MEKNCCVDNNKIKELRIKRNLNRFELADMCGVHEQTLWRIEAIPSQPTQICELLKIAEALDVPITELLKNKNINSSRM